MNKVLLIGDSVDLIRDVFFCKKDNDMWNITLKYLCLFIFLGLRINMNAQHIGNVEHIRKTVLQLDGNNCFLRYSLREHDIEHTNSSSFQFVSTQKGDEISRLILEKFKKTMPESAASTDLIFVRIYFDKKFNLLMFNFSIDSCDKSVVFDKEVDFFIREISTIDLSEYISIYDLDHFTYGALTRIVKKK